MFKKYRVQIFFSFVGAVIGYLAFHPYAMLAHIYMDTQRQGGNLSLHWTDLSSLFHHTFQTSMLPMALSFAFFNGIIGLLIGILIDRKKRLEQKKVALETLRKLMVTLSHHLLNANVIIGGMVRRGRRSDADILASLEVIEEQARKIDAVIRALKEVTEIKTADYTAGGKAFMIDITREIETILDGDAKEKGNYK